MARIAVYLFRGFIKGIQILHRYLQYFLLSEQMDGSLVRIGNGHCKVLRGQPVLWT